MDLFRLVSRYSAGWFVNRDTVCHLDFARWSGDSSGSVGKAGLKTVGVNTTDDEALLQMTASVRKYLGLDGLCWLKKSQY